MTVARAIKLLVATGIIVGHAEASAQTPGRPLIEEAALAMGGVNRVSSVRTLMLEGTGENYNLGQNKTPTADLPVFEVTSWRRAVDFANRRWQQDQTRQARFVTGQAATQRQRIGFDGVAVDIISDTLVRRGTLRAEADRGSELLYHPVGFLQVALSPGVELTEVARVGGLRRVRMNAHGDKYAIQIDPSTNLPAVIEKIIYHPMLGDVVLETRFADWKAVDSVLLPMRIAQRIDGRWPWADIRLTSARVNADVGDIAAPASVRSAQPLAPAQPNVTVDSVAPGIWLLAGQSHHSVAIEMRDHLLLVEAPQSDDRTLAVIARARELRPSKPLRAVINTHHHFDHSGGVRAAISQGLTVITHTANADFYRDLARRQHFIVQDALAKSPKPARIQSVTTRSVLTSGDRSVELHAIQGSAHSESMLVVYLPKEKLLIEADLYSPPAANVATPPPAPFARDLVANMERLRLDVERIVPIHGRVVPVADLRAAAAR